MADLNPQPLPPKDSTIEEVDSICPPWWPRSLWELHFIKRPGVGPINFPPAIDEALAALHIHTYSYMLADQRAAQEVRNVVERQLASVAQNLSKLHDKASGSP